MLPPQSPRGFSALARLYYFARPTETAVLRRLSLQDIGQVRTVYNELFLFTKTWGFNNYFVVELNTPVFYSCCKTSRKIDHVSEIETESFIVTAISALQIKANTGKVLTKRFFLFYWSKEHWKICQLGHASNKRLNLIGCHLCNTRCMLMYALIREGMINDVCY